MNEEQIAQLQTELRSEIGQRLGLPKEFHHRLRGLTASEIEADGKQVLKELKPAPAPASNQDKQLKNYWVTQGNVPVPEKFPYAFQSPGDVKW